MTRAGCKDAVARRARFAFLEWHVELGGAVAVWNAVLEVKDSSSSFLLLFA